MQKLETFLNKNTPSLNQKEFYPDKHKYLSQTQEAFYSSPKNISQYQSTCTLLNQGTQYISFPKGKRFINYAQSNLKHCYPSTSTLANMLRQYFAILVNFFRNFGKGSKFEFGANPLQLNPLLETPPPTLYSPKVASDLANKLGKFSYSKTKIQKRYCPDYLLPSIELAYFRQGPSPAEYQVNVQATINDKPKYHFGQKACAPNSEYQYSSTLTKKTRFENCSITFGKGTRSKHLLCQNQNPGPADYQNYDKVSYFQKYNPKQHGVKYIASIDKINKAKEYSKKLSLDHQVKYSFGSNLNKRSIGQTSLII